MKTTVFIIALIVFAANLKTLLTFEGKREPVRTNKPAYHISFSPQSDYLLLLSCWSARQLTLRGGSPRFFDEVDMVTPGEWRGIHGLGHTDEDGRPIPNDLTFQDKGPVVEEEEDDYLSEDDDLEDEQLSASLLDYEVSGSVQCKPACIVPLQRTTSPSPR